MDFNRIFNDFLASSGRTILSIFKGIILIPIITRLMGADSYGQWAAIIAFVTMIAGIGNLHLKGALIRYTPKEDVKGETISQLLLISSVAVIIFSVLILSIQYFIPIIPGSNANGKLTIAVISLISVEITSSVVYNHPRSVGRVKSYEIIQTIMLICEIISLGVILYLSRSLLAAIWMLSLTKISITLFVLAYYRPLTFEIIKFEKIKTYLQYSLPMVPKEMGSKLLANADKYLLLYLASPTAAGVYAVAYSGSMILYGLTSALNPTLYPNVVQAWEEESYSELQNLYYEIYKWYSLIGVPACFGLVLLSWPILRLLSTVDIAQNGWSVFSILVIAFFIRGYDNPIIYVLHAAERNDLVALINIFASLLNIALNLILIPIYGLYGAVFATFVANIAISSYTYMKVNDLVDLRFPVDILGKSVIASILMSSAIFIFFQDIGWWQKLIGFPVIGVVLYSIFIYYIGGLSRKEIGQISTLVK